LIDEGQWNKIMEHEKEMREDLQRFADDYEEREEGE